MFYSSYNLLIFIFFRLECSIESKSSEAGVKGPQRNVLLAQRRTLHTLRLSRLHGAGLELETDDRPVHPRRTVRAKCKQLSAFDAQGCQLHSHPRFPYLCKSSGNFKLAINLEPSRVLVFITITINICLI